MSSDNESSDSDSEYERLRESENHYSNLMLQLYRSLRKPGDATALATSAAEVWRPDGVGAIYAQRSTPETDGGNPFVSMFVAPVVPGYGKRKSEEIAAVARVTIYPRTGRVNCTVSVWENSDICDGDSSDEEIELPIGMAKSRTCYGNYYIMHGGLWLDVFRITLDPKVKLALTCEVGAVRASLSMDESELQVRRKLCTRFADAPELQATYEGFWGRFAMRAMARCVDPAAAFSPTAMRFVRGAPFPTLAQVKDRDDIAEEIAFVARAMRACASYYD